MKFEKYKELIYVSIIALSIIIHGFIVGPNRYELRYENHNWIVTDRLTGNIYTKFANESGPKDWRLFDIDEVINAND